MPYGATDSTAPGLGEGCEVGQTIRERGDGPGRGEGFPHGFHACGGNQPKPIAELPPIQFARVYPSQDGWERLVENPRRVLRGHFRARQRAGGRAGGVIASREDGEPMGRGKPLVRV